MRKIVLLTSLFISILCLGFRPAAVLVKPIADVSTNKVSEVEVDPLSISIKDILELKKSDFEHLLGAKPSFKQKMALKMLQQNLRKEVKKNGLDPEQKVNFSQQIDEITTGFNFGAFLLGLLLGLFGVLGAYLFSKDKNFIRWTWRGWFLWVAIVLAAVAASA